MPIRNLGPCACCVSRYPVKVIATKFASSYFQGKIVDGMMTEVLIAKVSLLDYTVYYSDGATESASYTSFYEGWSYYNSATGGDSSYNNDPLWSFDAAEHTATYSLPVTATDASGAVYNATIALKWDSDDLPRYGSADTFYDSLRLANAENGAAEFTFERVDE